MPRTYTRIVLSTRERLVWSLKVGNRCDLWLSLLPRPSGACSAPVPLPHQFVVGCAGSAVNPYEV